MERSALEWYALLARGLIWAAAVVLLLAVIAAVALVSTTNSLPLSEDVQREGRGFVALAAIGAGLAAAGVLSGLGGILRLLVQDRIDRQDELQEEPASAWQGPED
jgi:hypothetical protein